jgi:hypothetical protein
VIQVKGEVGLGVRVDRQDSFTLLGEEQGGKEDRGGFSLPAREGDAGTGSHGQIRME